MLAVSSLSFHNTYDTAIRLEYELKVTEKKDRENLIKILVYKRRGECNSAQKTHLTFIQELDTPSIFIAHVC